MINQSILDSIAQIPGLVVLKDLESKYIVASTDFCPYIGYKSPESVAGISDFDLRCGAASGAEEFISQDHATITSGKNITLNFYDYTNSRKIILCTKKIFAINSNNIGVICHMSDLLFSCSIVDNLTSLIAGDRRFLDPRDTRSLSYTVCNNYPDFHLSLAESWCLFYIMRGKTNKEIAVMLSKSSRTVDSQVESIKRKMMCDKRSHLVEKAIASGMLRVILTCFLNTNNLSLDIN